MGTLKAPKHTAQIGVSSSSPKHTAQLTMCGCNTKCGMFIFSALTVAFAVFAISGVGGNKFDWTRIRSEVDTPLGDATAWAYFGLTKFSGSVGFTNANANMLGALPKLTGTSAQPASEEGADRRYDGQECPAGENFCCCYYHRTDACQHPPFGVYTCDVGEPECCVSSPTQTPTPTPTPTPYHRRRRSYPSPTPTPALPSDGIWISYSDCADMSNECKICEQSGKASLAFSCIAAFGALLGSVIVLCRCHHESVSSAYTVVATLTLIAALVGWLAWFACFAQLVNAIDDVNYVSVAIFPTTGSWAMALTFIITAALTCAEKKRLRMVRCNLSSDRERLVVVVPPVTTSAVIVSQPYSNVPCQATTSGTASFRPPPPPPPPQYAQYEKVVSAWTEYADAEGNVYYHNAETNATTWERPER